MNRIFAALILSTAAIGAAQAGELGYRDAPTIQSVATRADVQKALDADRANVQAFQGQLDPSVTNAPAGTATRAQIAQQEKFAKVSNPAGGAFVNG
ncbi:DUF4148 domain-containing protein [Pigmentiphaga aceris]|uniref:DUF4148 domain-containing protein n=1 Tax=Pigmentiphaga aceris TaxID=1940612 RepID=A0A5C0B617_9BURK|nr:DUF4148 domain-containing protein [Pigmentiphaga aceris]QEI08800.1 DUF4148 domain-containing protein [Pigmentiphaga aceris]